MHDSYPLVVPPSFRSPGRMLVILTAALAPAAAALAQAPPTLPTIGSGSYSITTSNSNVDGGSVAVSGSSSLNAATNTAVINAYIAYASANGGGTVNVPAGNFISNELLLKNNVDLNVTGTLQNDVGTNTFITTASGTTGNIEISGSGTINNNATKTSNNKMIQIEGQTNVAVTGVTIENAPNEHLVTEADSNVTINGITIQDSKIQANTDGIDFSGTNYLIENCNISDGDDDIVAKPDTTVANGITAYTANVVITNDTMTAGHGISIGGQTNAGLNGMYVSNCTISGTEYGIHLKAGDGSTSATANGGPVKNVTFNNINISNVDDALIVDSFYNNGDDNFPGKPSASSPFPPAPNDSTEPFWNDITFENITISTTTGNAADIFGLNSTPANTDGLNFENITATGASDPWNMYYADDVYINGLTVDGVTIPDSLANAKDSSGNAQSQEFADTFDAAQNAIYDPTPEPTSISLFALASLLALSRRRN